MGCNFSECFCCFKSIAIFVSFHVPILSYIWSLGRVSTMRRASQSLFLVFCYLFVSSTAHVGDIPGIWPPFYPLDPNPYYTDVSPYLKQKTGDFVHPGIWHTHSDLELIRNNVLAGVNPWASAYAQFSIDSYSLSNYTMQGPYQYLERGVISNYTSFTNDVRAAWQNALMWYITKDQAHWTRATTILDAWGSNLTNIIGTDRSLLVGLEGNLFVNAAEIMVRTLSSSRSDDQN